MVEDAGTCSGTRNSRQPCNSSSIASGCLPSASVSRSRTGLHSPYLGQRRWHSRYGGRTTHGASASTLTEQRPNVVFLPLLTDSNSRR